ncbi:MAG: hypothetical protein EBU90_06760 [Proteobacteria bacterium]|nr:hypothetical protein [Pseudomonadota bacterium]NBP14052.1 hypothetical protein [bacterium]
MSQPKDNLKKALSNIYIKQKKMSIKNLKNLSVRPKKGYPSFIKLGSHLIPVNYYLSEPEAIAISKDRELFKEGQLYGAFISYPRPMILIDGRFENNPNHPVMTLLHECIEAMNELYGLELTEQDIRCLELGLYGLLKDNKMFFNALKKSIESAY